MPGVPWYGLRTVWLRDRVRYHRRNQEIVVRRDSEWLRQFWKRPLDVTAHPGGADEQSARLSHVRG
ncbi:hypothetical protein K6W81_20660 [Enterobacter sp. MW07]|nr:hypothetical protein [Enterobacter sp. MW07]